MRGCDHCCKEAAPSTGLPSCDSLGREAKLVAIGHCIALHNGEVRAVNIAVEAARERSFPSADAPESCVRLIPYNPARGP
jgi:hypothetical protein